MAVILAGGAGTRLRPLSSDATPKQFLKLFNGESLIQLTWKRLSRILSDDAIYVSTSEEHAAQSLEHLPRLQPENVLTEPSRRNTAPAIALCTLTIEQRNGECVVAFVPSDHHIGDTEEFLRVLDRAYRFAESAPYLVTIGIKPTEANTGFGYLELGAELEPGVVAVRRFTEKPSRDRAEEFLRAGNYAWNGGMFIWRTSVFRKELEQVTPELARVTRENYERMPAKSIDYELMEKSSRVATVRGDFKWSDVGSFEALEKLGVTVPPYTRDEIIDALEKQEAVSREYWNSFDTATFFRWIGKAWSPAETVRHLVKATRPVAKALGMPRLLLRILFGRARRPSMNYYTLSDTYDKVLADGVSAGRFAPSAHTEADHEAWRADIMKNFARVNADLRREIARWPEAKLDHLRLPHPALGKITVREMLLFTLLHHRHHIEVVERRLKDPSAPSFSAR